MAAAVRTGLIACITGFACVGNGFAAIDFDPAVGYPVQLFPVSIVDGDRDGDGDLDLAVANGSSSSISILPNLGDRRLPFLIEDIHDLPLATREMTIRSSAHALFSHPDHNAQNNALETTTQTESAKKVAHTRGTVKRVLLNFSQNISRII